MHCCIISCKIPRDMPSDIGADIIKSFVYPTLNEFGYVLPEPEIQRKINRRFGDTDKELSISIFLDDGEAMKTASIRAEWKPLETTKSLDSSERKALRRMSRKRRIDEITNDCPICMDKCKRPITVECDHTFCYECIKKWMGIKRQCPVCDKSINVSTYVRRKRLKLPGKKSVSQ